MKFKRGDLVSVICYDNMLRKELKRLAIVIEVEKFNNWAKVWIPGLNEVLFTLPKFIDLLIETREVK